jgi:hypothetical protein
MAMLFFGNKPRRRRFQLCCGGPNKVGESPGKKTPGVHPARRFSRHAPERRRPDYLMDVKNDGVMTPNNGPATPSKP